MKNDKNPNACLNEIRKRYGAGYDYSFLMWDNLQREFYLQMREKETKEKGANDQ